jgi:hypothetical protein
LNGKFLLPRRSISKFILVDGMLKGRFTSVRLGQYVNANRTDFIRARRVVNDDDRSKDIADLAKAWLSRLNSSEFRELFEVRLPFSSPADPDTVPDIPEELRIRYQRTMSS